MSLRYPVVYRSLFLRVSSISKNKESRKCVAVCCSVLQCVAVCCSVLQCIAVHCSGCSDLQCFTVRCGVLQCVAVCCSVLQRLQ